MTKTSRACGLTIVYVLLAILLACGAATAQEISADFTEGVRAFEERSYQEAITRLEAAVAADPENEAAWYYLGVARYRQGELEPALEALAEAAERRGDRPGIQLHIGLIYEELGAFDEAIRAYQTELRNRRFRNLAEVYNSLGRVYYFSGRYMDAIETLTEALEHNEKYVEALYYRALTHHQQREYERAMRDFNSAIEIVEEWDRKRRQLDTMVEREGDTGLTPDAQRRKQQLQEELAQDYSKAAEFAQELAMRPMLYMDKGDTAVALDEYGTARNAYRKALDPEHGGNAADPLPHVKVGEAYFEEGRDLFYNQGLLYTAISRVDAAIENVEEAIALDEGFPEAHKALGDIFLFQATVYVSDPEREIVSSTFEDVIDRYDAAIASAPEYVEAYTGRAQTYIEMGEPDDAVADLQTALGLEPRNPDLYAALATAQALNEEYEAAVATAQIALNLEPDNAQAHNAAGLAHYFSGRLGLASEHFTKAIEADPTQHQSYTNLGNTFFQLGSWHRARINYEKALELVPEPAIANTAVQRSYLHYLVARTYHFTGQYEREVEALNRALGLDSAYLEALTQLALAYQELGQFQASEQALRTALEVSPGAEEDAAIYVQMGRLYESEGRPYEAITAYGAAIAAQTDNPEAQEALRRLTAG
ncbi:MAG: tetratricopeptide repeat protein [candidate division WS1 bacterium]|jgi:tetratricopeptide (TPR) repeat protein|nr:tetratricopeptide repeat protein [candidate division WS1 bacterium]